MNTKFISSSYIDIKSFADIVREYGKWEEDKFYLLGKEIEDVDVYITNNYVETKCYWDKNIRVMSDVWDEGLIVEYTIRSVDDYSILNRITNTFFCNSNNKGVLVKSTRNSIDAHTKIGWYNQTLNKAINKALYSVDNLNLPCKIISGRKFTKASNLYIKNLKKIVVDNCYGYNEYHYVWDLDEKIGDKVSVYNVVLTETAQEYFSTIAKKIVLSTNGINDIERCFNDNNLENKMVEVIKQLYKPFINPTVFENFGDIATERNNAKKLKKWNEKKGQIEEWARKKNPTANIEEINRIVECVRKKYYV